MKKITVMLLLLTATFYCKAQNEGEITGKVLNIETKETLPNAHMILRSGEIKVMEIASDENGTYIFKPVKPGYYDIEILYVGYDTIFFTGIKVNENGINYLNFELSEGISMGPVTILPSLIDNQVPGTLTTFDEKMIGDMPVSSIQDVAVMAPAVLQNESTGGLYLGGSREDATLYVVDGVRVIGSLYLPMNSIKNITVITGGIPANYGDFTGGIIEITTKEYSGMF